MPGFQVHTRTLAAGQSMTIAGPDGVLYISYLMSGGVGDAGSISGTLPFKCSTDPSVVASAPVPIGPGQGNTFVADPSKPLDITIGCTTGSMYIIIGF